MLTVIQLSVVSPPAFFDRVPPKSPGEGLRMVYAEDLLYQGVAAGTHSGVLTTLRTNLPEPGPFNGGELIENEGTYGLKAVGGLAAGQVTVGGVVPIDPTGNPFAGGATPRLAITGGTAAYKNARGEVTYAAMTPHKLEIEL